jgi:hypothetical protein
MAEQLQRLRRPATSLDLEENPQGFSARGLNRSHLTLYMSVGAILLSIASAGIHLFIFQSGDRPRMAAETQLHSVQAVKEEALARAAQLDVALKTQQIATARAQELEAIASKVHHYQAASLEVPQAQSAGYQQALDSVTIGDPEVREILGNALKQGLKGNKQILWGASPGGLPPVPGFNSPAGSKTDNWKEYSAETKTLW